MPTRSRSLVAFAIVFFFWAHESSAGLLPPHDEICDTGVVSKKLLASYIIDLNTNKVAKKIVFGDAVLWRTIFTEEPEQFCSSKAVCRRKRLTGEDCKKEVEACIAGQDLAVGNAVAFFDELTRETAKKRPTYTADPALAKASAGARARIFFSSPEDGVNSVQCTAVDIPGPPPPSVIEKSPFRVRGVADDLYVDRSSTDAFKSTSQATLTSTGDRSTTPTQTLKARAALGYAFQFGMTTAIPYISFYQSITDTFGRPQNTDPSSNVAAGMLFTTSTSSAEVNHVISAKPQYLLNTKDHSEIGSLRLIYTPYTYFAGDTPNLNFFQPVIYTPIPVYASILFDLRLDAGAYADRGNNPVQRLLNRDFIRSGSRAGFAITTDPNPNAPSFTLVVAETYLYGFSGTVRNLNIFEASLTFNFNKYVGLTASYRNGTDEDTAIRVETWMVGLSGRF